jgi:arginyl-tRNA synthetase
MNLFTDIRSLVLDCLNAMVAEGTLPEGLDFANVAVEPPRDAAHGDMATNAAMVLAKPAKMKPRDIAEALATKLAADARVTSAEVAGPGFLNLRLDQGSWQAVLSNVLAEGTNFGRSNMGEGKKVNVEYVSANPTGPLHVGHTRGAVFGDALASLLDFVGFDVTREYYINDGGGQVDVLARSVYLRYLEAHGQEVAFVDGTYPGDYLVPVGEALKAKGGDAYGGQPEEVWLEEIRNFATDAMMDLIREDLASLGVKMDKFFSEKSLYGTGLIEAALKSLDDKGLIYAGVLEPPKGKKPDDAVGPDVTRFMLLTRKNDQGFDFDLDKALEQSKDNPVFYVQYANARICSSLRKAEEAGIAVDDATLTAADLSLLDDDAQLAVAKKIAEWPRLVEIAARTNEPHRVAFYLYDLASELHGLYHLGKTNEGLRFVNESSASATHAKMALAKTVSIVISAGLGILGVTPAQEMR